MIAHSREAGASASSTIGLPLVSVIIPVKAVNDYIRASLPHLMKQSHANVEIIVLPDRDDGENLGPAKVTPTWPFTGPADKRDVGAQVSSGEILAFLDDDAYPHRDWLASAIPHFNDPNVAAVGGPNVTPPDDSLLQRAAGWVLASRLGGGKYTYRVMPEEARDVDDFPSVNLLVRKSDFEALGGFDSHFWPGEDTKLCLDLTQKLGKRIVYDPHVLVYHHRRPLLIPYLKQIGRYGLHRGHFARVLPKTSARPSYFAPSLFTLGLLLGAFVPWTFAQRAYLLSLAVYSILVIGEAIRAFSKERDWRLVPLVAAGIVATHLWYGLRFLQGLFMPRLAR